MTWTREDAEAAIQPFEQGSPMQQALDALQLECIHYRQTGLGRVYLKRAINRVSGLLARSEQEQNAALIARIRRRLQAQ